jgi:hypothetical protein
MQVTENEKKEFTEFFKTIHKPKRYYSKRSVCNCLLCPACNKRFTKCRKDIHYKEIDENRKLTESEILEIYNKNEYRGQTTNYYGRYDRQGYRMQGTNEQTSQEMDKEEQAKK